MMCPMRVSFSTMESAYLLLLNRLVDEVRVRQVRLVHLHEIDVDEERLVRSFRRVIEEFERGLLDVGVQRRECRRRLPCR